MGYGQLTRHRVAKPLVTTAGSRCCTLDMRRMAKWIAVHRSRQNEPLCRKSAFLSRAARGGALAVPKLGTSGRLQPRLTPTRFPDGSVLYRLSKRRIAARGGPTLSVVAGIDPSFEESF